MDNKYSKEIESIKQEFIFAITAAAKNPKNVSRLCQNGF